MCVGVGKQPPPPPEVRKIQKKIVQPAEFRFKYAQNASIHVRKNVCLNGIYFSIFI